MIGSKAFYLPFFTFGCLAAAMGQGSPYSELTYFGRASVKIKTAEGMVVYIDPYAPGDYSEPADLVLVTHGHGDHNRLDLVTLKRGAAVAAPSGAVSFQGARYVSEGDEFAVRGIQVRTLPAANKNHHRSECVGYLLSFDGIVVYHAGDTDYLPEMAGYGKYGIGYALLPCDGFYNMGPEEASRCAAAMKARAVIPIHSSRSDLFAEGNARAVRAANVIVLEPGKKISLTP